MADQPADRRDRVWTANTGIDGQTPVGLHKLDLICIDPLPSRVWYQDTADFAKAIINEWTGREQHLMYVTSGSRLDQAVSDRLS